MVTVGKFRQSPFSKNIMLLRVVDDTPIQTGKVVPDEPLELDFQVVQAFPRFENLKDRQLHFSTEHGA
jgi:hypothetical protein